MDTQVKQRPVIQRTAVKSSQIAAVGYHPETQTMAIEFPNKSGKPNSVYHYSNVTPEQHAAFIKAESIGAHFAQHFKPKSDVHPYTKIS